MPSFDDLLREDYLAHRRRPAARHRKVTPARTSAPALAAALVAGIRDGLRAATARDVPTSTPTGAGEFRRQWGRAAL